MSKVFIEESTLTAIGDAIRGKTGESELLAPLDMPAAIEGIVSGGGDDVDITQATGGCRYKFSYNAWNDVLKYFTTKDLTECISMFYNCSELEEIPFDINGVKGTPTNCSQMFQGCSKLTKLPKLNVTIASHVSMFQGCSWLREIPQEFVDSIDWSYLDNYDLVIEKYGCGGMFSGCSSLRSIPNSILNHYQKNTDYSSSFYYNGLASMSIDEFIDLPVVRSTRNWDSNAFNSTFTSGVRLKNITFELDESEKPYKVNWKNQFIDFTYCGFCSSYTAGKMTTCNNGITKDKYVTTDAKYQALKNDPDWYTSDVNYSRYNHDSAVATINTLPDTSEYLATAGGTNTIKFKGAAGTKTDGGAISTLTEEEIAVATAKGWTVSIV